MPNPTPDGTQPHSKFRNAIGSPEFTPSATELARFVDAGGYRGRNTAGISQNPVPNPYNCAYLPLIRFYEYIFSGQGSS